MGEMYIIWVFASHEEEFRLWLYAITMRCGWAASSNYADFKKESKTEKRFIMKIYIVFKNMYHDPHHILKTFSDLNKAIDYAADFAMTRTNQYDRDYLKKIMMDQHDDPSSDGYIFVYTHYNNTDVDDEFVGIREVDVDE